MLVTLTRDAVYNQYNLKKLQDRAADMLLVLGGNVEALQSSGRCGARARGGSGLGGQGARGQGQGARGSGGGARGWGQGAGGSAQGAQG